MYGAAAAAAAAAGAGGGDSSSGETAYPPPAHMGIQPLYVDSKTAGKLLSVAYLRGKSNGRTSPPWRDAKKIRLYCLNNAKFDQSIISKIVKIVATRCQILRQNALNSISTAASGYVPDPAGGVYSAPSDPLSVLKGLIKRKGRRGGR